MPSENLVFKKDNILSLLDEMQVFFENNNIYIDVNTPSQLDDEGSTDTEVVKGMDHYIELFAIKAGKQPIYHSIGSRNDYLDIVSEIDRYREELYEKTLEFLEKNQDTLGEDFSKRLEMILRLMLRFKKTFNARATKLDLNECIDVKEIQEKAARFLSDIINDYLIEPVVDAFLSEFENGTSDLSACRILVRYLNQFFDNIGISTYALKEGEEMNYDLYVPTQSDEDIITSDFRLKDRVKSVKKYAYLFIEEGNEYPVSRGKAVVWRFE